MLLHLAGSKEVKILLIMGTYGLLWIALNYQMVPEAGIEPARGLPPNGF